MTEKIRLITEEELKERLADCLEEGRLPDYLLYVGEQGARNWLELDDSKSFPVARQLTDLLRSNVSGICAHVPDEVTLVSIGVGGGIKEKVLLEELGRCCRRYVAVDVSEHLLDTALRAVEGVEVEKLGIVAFAGDLPVLEQYWESPILLCLLGNNLSNYRPDPLLGTLSEHLCPQDLLLVDFCLAPTGERHLARWQRELAEAYRSPPNAAFNLGPLADCGLQPEERRFELELNRRRIPIGRAYCNKKRIEILRDVSVDIAGRRIPLQKGDDIEMGFTYHYTLGQARAMLHRHGFRALETYRSQDQRNLLALLRRPAQPTTHSR